MDMTRTIPVSGKFSKRQKLVYNSVLYVKNEATKLLRPGILWKEHYDEVGKIMNSELLKLGLISKVDIQNQTKKNPAFKKVLYSWGFPSSRIGYPRLWRFK